MKRNHHSLAYKRQAMPNKTYKDLKQKQKAWIADNMYTETLRFFLENSRMPDEAECDTICRTIYHKIESRAIWVPYDAVLEQFIKKQTGYMSRIQAAVEEGITAEALQKPCKPEKAEKPAKKRPKKKRKTQIREEPFQNDRFFFIAGYTSGGAPYGVTWEEMGLEPWEDIFDQKS